MADLAYRIRRALAAGDRADVAPLMAELAGRFRRHSLEEESGLFRELVAAGLADIEVRRLTADHDRLRPLLAAVQPDRIPDVLAELLEHAGVEENDLFPYALQVLPAPVWDRINGSTPAARPAAAR